MCTMLHIGSRRPFRMGPPEQQGAVAPAPTLTVPPALKDCLHIASLTSWHDGHPTCSCVFDEKSLPWEAVEEDLATVAAFDALRSLAIEHGSGFLAYSCDYSDVDLAPNVTCKLAPEHVFAGVILFNIPFSGRNQPRILVEFVPGLPQPIKPETLDVR